MKMLTQSQIYAGMLGHPGNARGTGFDVKWLHDNIVHVACPWVLTDGRNHFGSIAIHKYCAGSLAHVLNAVWDAVDKSHDEIERRHYHIFSGSLNYRRMRTGQHMSMHAYGVAIDWDAPDNALHSQRPRFAHDELLFVKFREEGWICGIDWRGNSIDAMHVQAAVVA